MSEALFNRNADKTLARVAATYKQRGDEYADTWRNCRWLAMAATAERLGFNVSLDQCRMLAAAAMVDIKYARLEGGYKDDTAIDGIAYIANWTQEMRRFELKGENESDLHSRTIQS